MQAFNINVTREDLPVVDVQTLKSRVCIQDFRNQNNAIQRSEHFVTRHASETKHSVQEFSIS